MRNQRTIFFLAIGLILMVSVGVAAALGDNQLGTAVSLRTDAPGEILQPDQFDGTPTIWTIGPEVEAYDGPYNKLVALQSRSTSTPTNTATTEAYSGDSLRSSPTASFSPTEPSEVDARPTATPSPTEEVRDTPTPTITPSPVRATSKPPTGNLLVNPYFDGVHNSTSIPGWVNDGHWDISWKDSNPSPPNTAARINTPDLGGHTKPGETAILYQIVEGGGANLAASLACVQHYAELMQVTIYGSDSSRGPWTPVWQPFEISGCGFADWGPTLHTQTQLPQAWAYYQFQVVARYDDERGGVKVTNASFSLQ